MVASIPHFQLAWGGTIGTPAVEVWSNRVNWANNQSGDAPFDNVQAACTAVAADVRAWFIDTDSQIGAGCQLNWVKLNFINAQGAYRDPITARYDYPVPAGGVNTSSPVIWPQTYCLTLRTALARGRGHSGRVYPPLVAAPLASFNTPYISTADADLMAGRFAKLMNHARDTINTSLSFGADAYDLVVHSVGTATAGPKTTEVISVVCDRVADIQHRRNRQVPRAEGTVKLISAAA